MGEIVIEGRKLFSSEYQPPQLDWRSHCYSRFHCLKRIARHAKTWSYASKMVCAPAFVSSIRTQNKISSSRIHSLRNKARAHRTNSSFCPKAHPKVYAAGTSGLHQPCTLSSESCLVLYTDQQFSIFSNR